jgi:DNA-binding Lrp family transcriptional regulator
MLKPQDLLVLLKLCGCKDGHRPSYTALANEIGMSQSEVHAAVNRLKQSRLLHGKEMNERPRLKAIEEFIIHGVKYFFPAEHSTFVRGMPTSYATEPLSRLISFGNDPIPVWPDPEGTERGIGLKPIYKSVPAAAKRDPLLYERLALVDALRDGRVRERKLAEEELRNSLRRTDG